MKKNFIGASWKLISESKMAVGCLQVLLRQLISNHLKRENEKGLISFILSAVIYTETNLDIISII